MHLEEDEPHAGPVGARPIFHLQKFKPGRTTMSKANWKAMLATLSKPSNLRVDRDLAAFEHLTAAIPILRNMREKERQALTRVARLQRRYKAEGIFTQGEPADALYIVLRGVVSLVKRADADENTDSAAGARVSAMGEVEEFQCFGEIEFLKNEPYKTSAFAGEDCMLMVASRSDYQAAMAEYLHETRARDIAFLQRVTLFSHWPPDRLRKLAERATDVSFGPDEIVIKQGSPPAELFLVKVGQLRQLRSVIVHDEDGVEEEVMLEADRVGQYGFFGEYCAIKGSSEQPCSVQATTNVTLTKIPDSEYRDFLRIYPSFRNDIKGYIDRRYPPDHKLVQQVAELRAWEAYKEGTTRCISRTAIPPSMRRFGREPPLPLRPADWLVDVMHPVDDWEDLIGGGKQKSSNQSNFLASIHSPLKHRAADSQPGAGGAGGGAEAGTARKQRAPSSKDEPGLVAIRQRRIEWQRKKQQATGNAANGGAGLGSSGGGGGGGGGGMSPAATGRTAGTPLSDARSSFSSSARGGFGAGAGGGAGAGAGADYGSGSGSRGRRGGSGHSTRRQAHNNGSARSSPSTRSGGDTSSRSHRSSRRSPPGHNRAALRLPGIAAR